MIDLDEIRESAEELKKELRKHPDRIFYQLLQNGMKLGALKISGKFHFFIATDLRKKPNYIREYGTGFAALPLKQLIKVLETGNFTIG